MEKDYLKAYLAGEIHTNWRSNIKSKVLDLGLPINLLSPITNHSASDDCGVQILGEENKKFWHDYKGAGINSIRNKNMIEKSNIVIVKFGDKYRQWNAAFDAGYASALGKPVITLHDPILTHPLKEVDGAALAVAETPDQVVKILSYVIDGTI